MTDTARTPLIRYGQALAALALATAARFALDPALGGHLPYVTYFVAIMAVARYGGLGPSLAALALGSLAATYFFVPPRGGLVPHGLPNLVGLGLYFFVGLSSILLCDELRAARRRAEALAAEAAEKEERLRVTLASIGDAVIAVDAQGRVAFMNPVAEALTGWRAGEGAGRPMEEVFRIVHEETRRPVESPVVRVQREGMAIGLANHTLLVSRDGAERPIAESAAPIRDSGGDLVGVVMVFRDETERRRMEVALEESEDHYRHAVELSPQLPWTAAPDGRITDFSDRWLGLTGLSREQALGDGWLRLPHPDDLPRMREAWGRSVGTGEPYDIEHRTRLATGDYRWMRSRAFPRRGEDGAVVRWYGTTEDITEHKEAEEAIRRQARLTGAITENATTAIFLMDAEGRTTFMNPAAEAMTGYALREIEGRVLHDVIHSRRPDGTPLPMDECPIGRHVLMQRELRGHEDIFFRKDGTSFPVRCAARPIVEGGSLTGIVLEVQDITEERRAEGHLALQARVLESMTEGVSISDEGGTIVYTNPAEDRIFGYGPGELVGRHVSEQNDYPPEENARIVAGVIERLKSEGSWSGEWRNRRKDGTPFWTFARITAIERGGERYWVCVQEDITERKRAEERLRESEERLRATFDQAAVGVAHVGMDGRILWANPGLGAMLGYAGAELRERTVAEVTHPDDLEADLALAQRLLAGEIPSYRIEKRYRHKDGSIVWGDLAASLVRGPGGEPKYAVGVLVDITQQKQAEARLEAVLASIDDHLASYDRRWRYTFVNDRAARVLGKRKDELIGECIWELFPEAVGNQFHREVHRAIEEQRVIRSEHYYAPFERWFENHIYPSPDGVTVFAADVTWRKRLEAELRRQNEQLAEADRRKDEFLATLAHELRNPLAPIRNALHLMREPSGGGHEEERAMAERQVVHLARLIDDLMDVARISRGKLELNKGVVDLHTVVRQAVQTTRSQIADRRHRLTITMPEGPVRLEADPTRLEQVFWNLLNNAAKYTEPGGRIDMAVEAADAEVVVRVRDTGIGIDPEMLPRLFQMFMQIGEHREHAQGGLGIGLGLVRTLVELHGGTITAHSEGPGRGSEFVVRLPVISAASPEPAPPRDRGRVTGAALPRRRILVVDDNTDAANSLARLLSRLHGQEVRVAHDGPTALEAAEAFRPEVALLDIGMPGMDGYEVARRLRAMTGMGRPLIVALTGWGQEADRQRTKEAGFDRHLVKPVDPDTLRGLIAGIGPPAV